MFSPVHPAPLQSLVIRPVLHAIFDGRLPGGSRLIEADLAAEFSISRAPVREALREIAAMGLIELRPNRGAVVMPFNPDSLRGIFHVRMALECEATRLAAGRIPPADLDRFEKEFGDLHAETTRERAWSDQTISSDEAFHELIATWAGIARLAMELKRYSILVHEIRESLRYRPQDETFRQHTDILNALRAGNADEAAEAMRRHILFASNSAVVIFFNETKR